MKESTRLQKDLKDYEICDKCQSCCLTCDKYKSVKEQNKECEVRKARARLTNRKFRNAKKKGIDKFDL